jgi:outer membrane protein assembly factor BamB
MSRARALAVAVGLAAAALSGCTVFDSEDPPLPGERVPVRQVAATGATGAGAAAPPLGAPLANVDWAQPNASASRAPGHLAGPAGLTVAWRADAGEGSGGSARITSRPVVADGRVFTLDAASQVTAFDLGGRQLWRGSVAPEAERGADGFGGGLAVADGRVYAATGFGEVVALGVADGAELWRRRLGGPIRAAPAFDAGRVIVVTRDGGGFALDAATGDEIWRAQGSGSGAGLLGGASPAVSGELAVLPLASGELLAVRASNGRPIWADALEGGLRGSALTELPDVTGDPVIAGAAVVAANQSGLMVAIDGRTGERGWIREIGSTSPAWLAGDSLFVVGVNARLHRLEAQTGRTQWAVDLPAFEDPEDREGVIAYAGPVVAGGRVYLTSSDDAVLAFDAQTGAEVGRATLRSGSTTGPIVAGGVLYVLSDDATLHAFR